MQATELNTSECFHCGLEADPKISSIIDNERRFFCCIGCEAVATAITEGGLVDFYRFRDKENIRPEEGLEKFEAYDLEALQDGFVSSSPNTEVSSEKQVKLLIGGISCAACAWLIEHYLEQLNGVSSVRVNVATHHCVFLWQPEHIKLSAVFSALHKIGYRPQPGTQAQAQKLRDNERRSALLRIGVAGLGMMQVGMVGVALHAGAIQGIDATWQHFLRYVSLIFAIPVMFYSALPFFRSAWRTLSLRRLNMDVPVSLALLLAFGASVLGTYKNIGEVYFDSISMFTFFLLVGRYLEMKARHTSVYETEKLSQLLPVSAERFVNTYTESARNREGTEVELVADQGDAETELVPLSYLSVGDSVRIAAGEAIPCDGYLQTHNAMVDESLLTGESALVEKQKGDMLFAGSVLAEPSVVIQVSAVGEQTRLASVQALLDQAIATKPKQQQVADKVAGYFVLAVLIVCLSVFAFWYVFAPEKAFWIALSVLVVTCPCALSLATPAALATGLNKLRKMGLLVVSPSALEVFPSISHVVFDKTGTLTLGEPCLQRVKVVGGQAENDCAQYVAALEQHTRHPIAKAFQHIRTHVTALNVQVYPGQGVEGNINEKPYRFGRSGFALYKSQDISPPSEGAWQLLSCNSEALAWFLVEDAIRPQLNQVVRELSQSYPAISLLSGDRQENVDAFVRKTELAAFFHEARGELLPEDKLSSIQVLRQQGDKILMVGDGINDVPVLAGADLSIAMGGASQLAKVNADAVLLNQNLNVITLAMKTTKQINRVIRQNFSWALGYNLLALPAAAMGYIPPYLAALGMSLSSLVVVLNSLRVSRT